MQIFFVKRVQLGAVLCFLLSFTSHAHDPIFITKNLTYIERTCQVNEHEIDLREIHLNTNSTLEFRVLPNPYALVDPKCPGGYGGRNLVELLQKRNRISPKIFAAINGNFFKHQAKSNNRLGFTPTGMLWSKVNQTRGKLYAALQKKGGNDLLLIDRQGAHQLSLSLNPCENHICVSLLPTQELNPKQLRFFFKKMTTHQFLGALQAAFPTMTLASQMTMDLSGGKKDPQGKLIHYSQCTEGNPGKNQNLDDDIRSYWKCKKLPRTVLCGKRDGSISVLTTPSAFVYDLATGLRPLGACATECDVLFNLDGGGSTQMAYTDPKNNQFQIFSGYNSRGSQTGCNALRPVDHYFVIEASSAPSSKP